MGRTPQPYDDSPRDTSEYVRRELFREWHARRIVYATLGDAYIGLARAWVRLNGRNTPLAVAACWKAVDAYKLAGMNRQARTVWRWAQFAHAAHTREVQG